MIRIWNKRAIQLKTEIINWIKGWIPDPLLAWYKEKKYQGGESKFSNWNTKQVFDYIYYENYWQDPETVSGPGSTVVHMQPLIEEITRLFEDLEIGSITDAACGDFNWMQHLHLQGRKYHGVDIVSDLIQSNRKKFEGPGVVFSNLDVLRDPLPSADLIFMRDLLVHFSFDDIWLVLANLQRSQFRWVMTTTFRGHARNWNICTGDWRPLNLEKAPFFFPKPHCYLAEKVNGQDLKALKFKSLAIWDMVELKNHLGDLSNNK